MISPFTPDELDLVAMLLHSRYLAAVPVEAIEAEVQVDPAAPGPAACPGLYWEARGAHFVVVKTAADRFRGQFFYGEQEQFGTGRPEYDNLGDCITTMLRLQSDHERTRAGAVPAGGRTGAPGADYDGPPVI